MNMQNNAKRPLNLEGGKKVTVGVGWDKKRSDGPAHDLDTSILLLSSDGQCHEMQDLCCYKEGHRTVHGGALIHYGDETQGAKSGDDERIDINLDLVPAHVMTLLVVVSIHHASARRQNFGQVNGAYVRILSQAGSELASYDLSEEASTYTAIEFCRLTREGDGWDFTPIAKGTSSGLAGVISQYGFSPK